MDFFRGLFWKGNQQPSHIDRQSKLARSISRQQKINRSRSIRQKTLQKVQIPVEVRKKLQIQSLDQASHKLSQNQRTMRRESRISRSRSKLPVEHSSSKPPIETQKKLPSIKIRQVREQSRQKIDEQKKRQMESILAAYQLQRAQHIKKDQDSVFQRLRRKQQAKQIEKLKAQLNVPPPPQFKYLKNNYRIFPRQQLPEYTGQTYAQYQKQAYLKFNRNRFARDPKSKAQTAQQQLRWQEGLKHQFLNAQTQYLQNLRDSIKRREISFKLDILNSDYQLYIKQLQKKYTQRDKVIQKHILQSEEKFKKIQELAKAEQEKTEQFLAFKKRKQQKEATKLRKEMQAQILKQAQLKYNPLREELQSTKQYLQNMQLAHKAEIQQIKGNELNDKLLYKRQLNQKTFEIEETKKELRKLQIKYEQAQNAVQQLEQSNADKDTLVSKLKKEKQHLALKIKQIHNKKIRQNVQKKAQEQYTQEQLYGKMQVKCTVNRQEKLVDIRIWIRKQDGSQYPTIRGVQIPFQYWNQSLRLMHQQPTKLTNQQLRTDTTIAVNLPGFANNNANGLFTDYYEGKTYIGLRGMIYYDGVPNPTKHGINFLPDEWKQLLNKLDKINISTRI